MIPPNTIANPITVLENFLDVWSGDLGLDIGPHLSCDECEALCDLMEVYRDREVAEQIRLYHALSDDDGDMPQHVSIKAQHQREEADV